MPSLSPFASAALVLTAFGLTVVACWPLRRLALRLGILDRPALRKAHERPTPYLGGIGIWLGSLAALAVFRADLRQSLALAAVVALGVADDVLAIGVSTKLIAQLVVAVGAVAAGAVWRITDSPLLNDAVTLIWIVGLTNAFNLLDNMDGLASTVAAAGLLALALIDPADAPFALAMAGAAIGFLTLNWPPARMFMGDAGSLALGFALALCTVAAANHTHGVHSLVLMVGPVLVALFDTLLVIVSRLLSGRPIQLGGTDHYSHRLRLQGWSRQQVLGGSAVAAGLGGLATYLAVAYPVPVAWLALPLLLAAGGLWLWLLKVDPYVWESPAVAEVSRA